MEIPSGENRSIEARAALLLQLRRAGVRGIAIMRAFEEVPREFFAPYRFRDLAARNVALPIGCGQTLPAPAVLARRIEALGVESGHRVLEIGTGSGYSAAVLARFAREVVTIERYETLATEAGKRLQSLSIANVRVLFGDGFALAPSLGPFDRILIHMSLERTPHPVLETLAPRGVAVFGRLQPSPEGERASERLCRLVRDAESASTETDLGPCRQGPALEGAALAL